MTLTTYTERKSGGWVTLRHALGPLFHERTVSWRDRRRQHSWRVGASSYARIEQGFPRGPIELRLNTPRVSLIVKLRKRR